MAIGYEEMPEPDEFTTVEVSGIPGKMPFQSSFHASLNLPEIDSDLRQLVGWCSADDYSDRPSLKQLLNFSEAALHMKTEAHYRARNVPYASRETDAAVNSWVQSMILNPIVDEDSLDDDDDDDS